jgi:hypothetical protein
MTFLNGLVRAVNNDVYLCHRPVKIRIKHLHELILYYNETKFSEANRPVDAFRNNGVYLCHCPVKIRTKHQHELILYYNETKFSEANRPVDAFRNNGVYLCHCPVITLSLPISIGSDI